MNFLGKEFSIVLDPKDVNRKASYYTIGIVLLSTVVYTWFWGLEFTITLMSLLKFIGFYFLLIFLHELLHGVGFLWFGKVKLTDLKFGFIWKYMVCYAHCKVPISMRAFRMALLLPVLLTGFVPLIIGLVVGNGMLVAISTLLVGGGAGDWLIYRSIHSFSKDTLVKDHKDNIGCTVYFCNEMNENKNINT